MSVFSKRVRFESAAEFLAACASGDTEEAKLMLKEAEDTNGRNGEDVPEIINCSNADGITALHQVECSVLPSVTEIHEELVLVCFYGLFPPSIRLSRSREHQISGRPEGDLLKCGTNAHLDSRTT